MKKQSHSSSDSSSEQKPELSILSVLVSSLFIGLIAGAGTDKSHILPVALIAAIVLFATRKKIAARDIATQSSNDLPQDLKPTEDYYAWPESGQFAFAVAAESYQGAIHQLAQKNAIGPDEGSDPKARILKAHLIPDNDNPYDSNAVRIDIDNRTIGHLNRDQARSFRRRLDEKGIPDQITTCNVVITKNGEINDKTVSYGVRLDIQPFE